MTPINLHPNIHVSDQLRKLADRLDADGKVSMLRLSFLTYEYPVCGKPLLPPYECLHAQKNPPRLP